MAKKQIVQHLEKGVRVRCSDGAEIVCDPMSLGDAKWYLEQWERIETGTPRDQIDARLKVALRFQERYPKLAGHIAMGDVEMLLPGFFWKTTGAHVVLANSNGHRSTGTRSGPTTAPAGASSPT